jgi:hypothetical protein
VPKGKKTFCKKCKKHAAHKVTQYKTGKASLYAQGVLNAPGRGWRSGRREGEGALHCGALRRTAAALCLLGAVHAPAACFAPAQAVNAGSCPAGSVRGATAEQP